VFSIQRQQERRNAGTLPVSRRFRQDAKLNIGALFQNARGVRRRNRSFGKGEARFTAISDCGCTRSRELSSDRKGAERVAQAIIDSGGEAIAVEADVFKAADVAPLFKEVTAVTISLSISFTAEKATALSICRNIGLPFGV
jgi:hypothetical protein